MIFPAPLSATSSGPREGQRTVHERGGQKGETVPSLSDRSVLRR